MTMSFLQLPPGLVPDPRALLATNTPPSMAAIACLFSPRSKPLPLYRQRQRRVRSCVLNVPPTATIIALMITVIAPPPSMPAIAAPAQAGIIDVGASEMYTIGIPVDDPDRRHRGA